MDMFKNIQWIYYTISIYALSRKLAAFMYG